MVDLFVVYIATFNNIPVISWRSIVFVEKKPEYPKQTNHLSQVTDKLV
jgi:hypothetical protein